MSSHSNEQEPNSRRMRNIFNVKNKSKARQIQASLVYTFLIAVAAIALNVVVSEKSSLSILYTNMIFGSGSTVASRIDNAWSVLFVSNQTNPTSFYYNSTSSTLGRSDFFLGVTQFGASDSDVSSSQLKLFLPDNTSGIANLSGLDVTKYINPSFPNHLGTIMLPEVGAGIGIVYNVAPFQNNAYNLNFTAKLLGDIFCANITKWNDPAIVALNPSFDFTTVNNTITIIGRSDSSGSTQILTGYMSKYSSNFNKAIGSSSQPTWPATFQLRSASSDLLYATETIPYSISYSPLDSIGALIYYRVASVVNKNNITVYPTATSIQASMINSTSIGIKKHNYISITDSNVINAYPISIYTFILINEFYWFNATGSNPSSCNSITSMIDYWRYAWTSPEAKTTASSLGFIPLSDDVVASNLEALKSVHCKNESVMNTLDFRSNSLQFYNDGIFTFNIGPTKMGFRGSVKFTDRIYSNPSNFSIAPIGTIIFSLFFIIFSLISIFTVINSFYRVINSDTHGLQTSFYSIASAPTGPELKRPSMLDKPLIIVKNPRFTAENLLFLISSIPTIIQFFCVSLNKSKVIQDNQISLEILKYSGIGIDKSYFISLMFFSTIWILGVLFATFWFRYVKENYTISIIKYAKPISKYMSYFALFATFFSMPVFLMITSVFDCRFNPLSGLFISVYDPVNIVCFSGIHWIMVGFAYLIGFPFAFLAINKTHYLVSV